MAERSEKETSDLTSIRPHSAGTDICGSGNYCYTIVRSDLGYYMKLKNGMSKAEAKDDYTIHVLNPACSGGDHYVSNKTATYIIKGDHYRRVTDLTTDADAVVKRLPTDYRGADFYVSQDESGNYPFYAIFTKRGEYVDPNGDTISLDPSCREGLYYWATEDYFYFVKPDGKWNAEYHACKELHKDSLPVDFSIDATVCNFLPGGLEVTLGRPSTQWVLLKTVSNNTGEPLSWNQGVAKKIGYKKSIEVAFDASWSVEWGGTVAVPLFSALLKATFSAKSTFGVNIKSSWRGEWNEETEVSEHISITIPPGRALCIWQPKIGMGYREDVISCRDVHLEMTEARPVLTSGSL